jgi:tRNA(fMet)-specific endonuclease VapC
VKYLLDTDHASFMQRRSSREYAVLTARMAQHPPSDFALAIVSFHEQLLGGHNVIHRARTVPELIRAYGLLEDILRDYRTAQVLPFDAAAAAIFLGLRGQQVGLKAMDLRIASIALSRGLVVLTRNSVDFSKVPGLAIEDWTV